MSSFLEDPNKIKEQIKKVQSVLDTLKINGSSAELQVCHLINFYNDNL